jgi:hypothetical protein
MTRFERELQEQLTQDNLTREERRDLQLAMAVTLSARGQIGPARQRFQRLRDEHPDDPVIRDFALKVASRWLRKRPRGGAEAPRGERAP